MAGRRRRSPRCRRRPCPGAPMSCTATCATATPRSTAPPAGRWRRWCGTRRAARCRHPRDGGLPGRVQVGQPGGCAAGQPWWPGRAKSSAVAQRQPAPVRRGLQRLPPRRRRPALLGVNLPLALNSNLHSDRPDNLLRVILEGVQRAGRPRHRLHAGVPPQPVGRAGGGDRGLHAAAVCAGPAGLAGFAGGGGAGPGTRTLKSFCFTPSPACGRGRG
jgi:hypothetical protein